MPGGFAAKTAPVRAFQYRMPKNKRLFLNSLAVALLAASTGVHAQTGSPTDTIAGSWSGTIENDTDHEVYPVHFETRVESGRMTGKIVDFNGHGKTWPLQNGKITAAGATSVTN